MLFRSGLYTEDEKNVTTSNDSTSSGPEDDITVLTWEKDDPENPYNFSKPRKNYIIFVSIICILNATLGSSLPSNIVPSLSEEWNIDSTYQKILPISVYITGECLDDAFLLVGYAVGVTVERVEGRLYYIPT